MKSALKGPGAGVVCVTVTERGRALASKLPGYEHIHGGAAGVVAGRWDQVSGFVLFLATGAAVRIVAPLLTTKDVDPAVVCVDEAGRFAVSLCGGHAGGANDLARQVASALGATPVVTTATDAAEIVALDQIPGLTAEGDVAGVTVAVLDGRRPEVIDEIGWPLPAELSAWAATSKTARSPDRERVVITDRLLEPRPGSAILRPPSLVVGVGASSDAPAHEAAELLALVLAGAGLSPLSVGEVATVDKRAGDATVTALGLPVRSFGVTALAGVEVPSPSEVVRRAVGTPSVAEAAALLAAGPGAELVVAKCAGAHTTVAVARRRRPRGHLALVGLGPGSAEHRTGAATAAVRNAEVVVGYERYLLQCADLLSPRQEVMPSPIGDEVTRAKQAVAEATAGRRVALVCSGDSGVYGMASITLEMVVGPNHAGSGSADPEPGVDPGFDVEVIPGVTAALAASAVLGAPLGHDHVAVSLSDLLTPWKAIEARLRAAAEADLVVVLYNPRSSGRQWQLDAARRILLVHRKPSTPVGVVTSAARADQRCTLTTLARLDPQTVNMVSLVIVGSSTTRFAGPHMITPRGYECP